MAGFALFHHCLVQRPPRAERRADDASSDDVEHVALVDVPLASVAALGEAVEGVGHLVRLDLGEVAEHTEVDAEERDGRAVEEPHRPKHRPVAAEAQGKIGVFGPSFGGQVVQVECNCVGGGHPDFVTAIGEPVGGLARQRRGDPPLVMGDDDDRGHATPLTRAWTRNSRLPSAPVIGEEGPCHDFAALCHEGPISI